MPKLHFIPLTESAKIILQTVTAVTLLLIPFILTMTFGTRMIVKEEVGGQVDHALDGIAYRIDNTLLCVEQTATVIHEEIPNHLDNPLELFQLCEKALKVNPSIDGCAIALNPTYYTVDDKPFMAYVHRSREPSAPEGALLASKTFTSRSYTEQEWYTIPLTQGVASWVGPLKNENTEDVPLISYDIPIVKDSLVLGVLGVDMSLSVLTQLAQNYKTSTHSHIVLLDSKGSYIVHPDHFKLLHMDGLDQMGEAEDPAVIEIIRDITQGQSGRRQITLNSTPYLMAFMPFLPANYPGRAISRFGWSIAIIYPQAELDDEYDPGLRMSLGMILVGILLLAGGAIVIFQNSVRPLKRLMYMTQIMSKGDYTRPGFETSRTDEIGRLQNQYNKMQHAVSAHMDQLQTLSKREAKREETLAKTYAKTQEVKEQKAVFFGNMTHQMADVTSALQDNVDKLHDTDAHLTEAEEKQVFDNIERHGQHVTEILNDMLNAKG